MDERPKPLDELYAEGASERLWVALPGDPEIEELPIDDGAVRVNVDWGYAEMKIECHSDTWRFLSLFIYDEQDRRNKLYTKCVESLSELSRTLGVTRWWAEAGDEVAAYALMRRGGWKRQGLTLTWDLGE